METFANEYTKVIDFFVLLCGDKIVETQHAFFMLCKLIPAHLNADIEIDKSKNKLGTQYEPSSSSLTLLSSKFSILTEHLLKIIILNDRNLFYQIFLEGFKSLQNLLVIWFDFINNGIETVFIRHFSDIPIKKNYFATCNIQIDNFAHVVTAQSRWFVTSTDFT